MHLDERGRPSQRLITPEVQVPVWLGVSGRHQVGTALLARPWSGAAGLPATELGPAVSDLRRVSTRRIDVYDRPDGVTVIGDSYNANPASTAMALATTGRGRRRIAVRGCLAELGERERAAQLGTDRVVVVGGAAGPIHDGAVAVSDWGGESVLVTDQEAAVARLPTKLSPGDVVLVKGSRYRRWAVADALRDQLVVMP